MQSIRVFIDTSNDKVAVVEIFWLSMFCCVVHPTQTAELFLNILHNVVASGLKQFVLKFWKNQMWRKYTLDLCYASRVARFLAAKYGILLYIRDVRQGQYLRLLLYYALTRSLQLSHSTTL